MLDWKAMKKKTLLLLFALGCVWGPAFMFMKIAIDSFPPITIAALRVTLAAMTLFIATRIMGISLTGQFAKRWKHYAVMGFFASAFPFCLFPTAVEYIPSSLAGILNATTPIFTCILAHYVASEPINRRKFLGILGGLAGVLFIYLPKLNHQNIGGELGILLAIVASISYAIGMVYAKRNLKDIPFLVAPTWQLIFASIYLIPASLIFDQSFQLQVPTLSATLATLALGVISTALSFTIYYTVLREAGASYLSMSTLLFPIVAIILGYLFLNEQLSWQTFVGTGLILSGLFISSPIFKRSS